MSNRAIVKAYGFWPSHQMQAQAVVRRRVMYEILRLVGFSAVIVMLLLVFQVSMTSSLSVQWKAGAADVVQAPIYSAMELTFSTLDRASGTVASGASLAGLESVTATLSLSVASVLPGGQVTVPLTLDLPEGQVYAVDISLAYDPGVVLATGVERGTLATGWAMALNTSTPGTVHVAIADATPIEGSGELLLFVLDTVGPAGSESDLTLTRGDLNEGAIPAELIHGHVRIAVPVQADFVASPQTGETPLEVVFTNTSSGDYSSSLWDFGDSVTSILDSPVHTYTPTGTYTVTLTASGPGGTDVVTYPNLISVLPGEYDGIAHVQSIKMRYSERGGKGYMVTAYVRIVDDRNQTVSDATVYARWTLSGDLLDEQDSATNRSGTARFTVKSNWAGLYEICVTDVIKEGWLFEPDQNRDCETLMITQ